jgi:ABC-2 type transport system permease protein
MITDIYTIIWKELRELLYLRGRMRGGRISLLVLVGILGIFMPLQSGKEWFTTALPVLFYGLLPFTLVSSVIADSFAGERERHTLETLLASRLADTAILYGKIIAAQIFGWGLTMLCAVLGVVAINLVYGRGELLFFPLMVAFGIMASSLLVSGFVSGLGVIISLRSTTVRQAQQTFSIAFFALFIPLFALPLLPQEWHKGATAVLEKLDFVSLGIAVAAILLVVDIGLLVAARLRFRRDRLILD